MFALTQLIFIDSYSPGKRAKVSLRGNTNLNGDNGAGKTTMLRVLPLFFGAAPGQLVRQSGSNQSFVNYYLPRLSSYIIFEYEREGDKNLVVIFRREQSIRVCLLEGAYEDELFFVEHKDSPNVIPSTDWIKTMKLRGLKPTQAMGVEDYKQIIQSSLRFTASSDRKRKLIINENRSQFSYCRHGSSIENIDLIATAILEREPSINAIKEILTSILVASGSVDSELPQLSIKPAKLTAWINDKKSYQAMCDRESDIKELSRLKFQYDETIKVQQVFRYHATGMSEGFNTEFKLLESDKESAKNKLDNHEKHIRDKKKSYRDEKDDLESSLSRFDKQIKALEKERDEYNKQEISKKIGLVKQITIYQKEIFSTKNKYDELINEQQDIESKFEELKSKRRLLHQETINQLQDEDRTFFESIQKQKDTLATEKAEFLEKEEKKSNKQQEKLQNRLVSRKEEAATIKAQLANITPPIELSREKKNLEEKISDLMMQTESFENAIQKAKEEEQQHKSEIRKTSLEADEKIREKRRLEKDLEHLRQLKSPSKNNLLSFLRDNHDSWTKNIAKVVPESLLLRSDLSPELIKNEQTLYGVKLDLSLVESSRAADETELQNKMLLIDNDLEQLDNTLKELEFTSSQLNKQTKSFEVNILSTESKLKQHKKNIKDIQEERGQLELRIDQALANQKKELKDKQAIIDTQVKDEEIRIDESRQAYTTLKQNIQLHYKEKYNTLAIQLRENQNELQKRTQISEEKTNSEIIELDAQKKSALIEKGVNPDYLDSLTKDLEEKEKLLNKAKESEELVEKYHRWLNNSWSEYDSLQAKHKTTNETLHEVIEQWKIQKKDLDQKEKELQGKLQKIATEYNQTQSEITLLQRVLGQYPDKGIEKPENTSNILLPSSPSILENKWLQESKKEKDTAKTAEALYATICRSINTYRDSTPQRFLERMNNDISSQYTHIRDEWIFAEEKIADYMRQGHQDHLQMLQSDAQLMGSQISDYFSVLERTHKQVNSLGTVVSNHAKEVIKGFSAISNLSITVLSSLDKLDFWNALQNFSASHHRWRARSTALNALPDDGYIENLSLVSTLIEKSGINRQLERSFDISFSITDQGKTKTARTSKELKDISSNGLAYLILISIYIALVNMLRGNSGVVMIWPVDELRNFSATNAVKLMALLKQHQIVLFSAFPDPDPELLKHYKNRYLIEKGRTLVEYPDELPDTANEINALLTSFTGEMV